MVIQLGLVVAAVGNRPGAGRHRHGRMTPFLQEKVTGSLYLLFLLPVVVSLVVCAGT